MPKIPRDISGKNLAKILQKYGYVITRQKGSHIRLTSNHMHSVHNVTIPDHAALKIGTLDSILADIASYLKTSKQQLVSQLFK